MNKIKSVTFRIKQNMCNKIFFNIKFKTNKKIFNINKTKLWENIETQTNNNIIRQIKLNIYNKLNT